MVLDKVVGDVVECMHSLTTQLLSMCMEAADREKILMKAAIARLRSLYGFRGRGRDLDESRA